MSILSEEDDWAVPSRSSSQVPRPNFTDLKPGGTAKVSPQNESRYALRNRLANTKTGAVAAYGTADSIPPIAASDTSLVETQQTDLDIEGALQTLPPAYREVLKKQLALVQHKGTGTNPLASMLASKSDSEMPLTKTPPVDNRSASSEVNAVANVPATEKKKTGVSVRLTDSVNESSQQPTLAEAESPKTASPNTDTASSMNNAVAVADIGYNESGSKVVQASATAAGLPAVPSLANTLAKQPETPSQLASQASWRQSIAQATEQLEKQIVETPASDESLRLSQEITLRLLYVAQRRLEDAARPIEMLSENEQEFIRHEMLALYEANNPDAMPVRSRHWTTVMNSQREATNYLAAASNIEVKSLAFCTEVERYGVITKFPKYQFRADEEVLLYCEIENVAAEKVRSGYETQLQGSYEIIDAQGRKIADQLLPMEPEICQNHRRDYFIVYKLYMPQQIATGNYQMKLTIEDMKGRKFGQSQIDFQIKK
ncbi:MAG: hypothetical protein ABL921_11310 [Pirellula sp.]